MHNHFQASTLGLVKALIASGEANGASILCPVPRVAGGLTEPAVVPRFLDALCKAGAHPVRADAYLTTLGADPVSCAPEVEMLLSGQISVVAFSSTAEVSPFSIIVLLC